MKTSTQHDDKLQRQIEQLVDGELPPAERVALLATFDDHPDHWRHCALAFIESQALSEAFRDLGMQNSDEHDQPEFEPMPIHRSTPRVWRRLLAAAMIGLVFLLGLIIGQVAQQETATPVVVENDGPEPQPTRPVNADPQPDRSAKTAPAYVEIRDKDGRSDPIRVPVVNGARINPDWLAQKPADIPEYMIQVMARKGYEIKRHRELVSVPGPDGQKVLIPVEKVSWAYVGHRVH